MTTGEERKMFSLKEKEKRKKLQDAKRRFHGLALLGRTYSRGVWDDLHESEKKRIEMREEHTEIYRKFVLFFFFFVFSSREQRRGTRNIYPERRRRRRKVLVLMQPLGPNPDKEEQEARDTS